MSLQPPVYQALIALRADYNQLQIPFVKNEGQVHTDVSFYTKTRGGTVFVTGKGELVFSLPQESEKDPKRVVIKEVLQGAKAARPRGEEQSAARVNYFKGADPTEWRTHITTFDRVTLGEVYTGIELALKTHGTSVEKLFLVQAGADPAAIRIQVEGIQALSVTESGELALTTGLGTVTFTRPVAYQEIEGKRVEVAVAYQVQEPDDENKKSGARSQESEGSSLSACQPASLPAHITPVLHKFSALPKPQLFAYRFKLGEYNKSFPLIIDPMLSTYLGGSGLDCGYALDTHYIDDLYVYVTGYTESDDDFPGLTGVQTDFGRGGRDVFVARLDHDLRVLDATYLGGNGEDEGFDITCHYSHHYVYVVGFTDSTDFPTAPAAGRGRGGELGWFHHTFHTGPVSH